MTYKTATDLAQRRARQLWLADLQGARWEELSPLQQRENLEKIKQRLDKALCQLPRKSDERSELGRIIHELDERIREIRPKIHQSRGWQEHFVDIARERMTPFLFKKWMGEASSRADAQDVQGAA